MNIATPESLQRAAAHLRKNDATLRQIVTQAGLSTIKPHRDYYRALVEEIIGQQLSVKAAASIRRRFYALYNGSVPEPDLLLAEAPEQLRRAGLSAAKVAYIRDLAQQIHDGSLPFDDLDLLSNKEIVTRLVRVKGIGEWTAHMFLIFCIGRLDVLPTGDLGIRRGVHLLYGLTHLPTPAEVSLIAATNHWHPYESVASWYVWQSLNNTPAD